MVHWLAKNLDGYRRGLNATLVACHLTLPMAYGLYQCQLNRSRGSAVKLWSALLQIMPTTIETVTSEGPNVNQENHIGKENIANIHIIKFGVQIQLYINCQQKSFFLFVPCYFRYLRWIASWYACGDDPISSGYLHVLHVS